MSTMLITDSKARGEIFGAGNEISRRIVDENVQSTGAPDRLHHLLDGIELANVTGERVDRTFGMEFGCRRCQHLFAAAADVNRGPEFEKAFGHASAQAGTAARDQD